MKRKVSLRTTVFVLIVILAFFENWFVDIFPMTGYFDEVLALFMLVYCLIVRNKRTDRGHQTFAMIIIVFVLIIWGIICNFYAGVQKAPLPIIEDIMSLFKFLYVYLGIQKFLKNRGVNTRAVLKAVLPLIKIYCLILAVFAIINLFINV